ncbi:MAG: type II toxin-antitoxin system VapB family antitoxin [Pseudomonadota bacterium]
MKTTVFIDPMVMDAVRDGTGLKTKREVVDHALRFFLDHVERGDLILPGETAGGRIIFCEHAASAFENALSQTSEGSGAARLLPETA